MNLKTLDLEKTDEDIVGKEIEITTYPDESVRLFFNKTELFLKDKGLMAS